MKKNKRKSYFSQLAITCLCVFSIAIIAFLTYSDTLGYFFIFADTLSSIETSQIHSFRDLIRIFTNPIMDGSVFVDFAKYYRPISMLSFSMDYFLWELNPFGYHLTNLVLHISVSILIFFTVRFLTNGQLTTAWVSAIIFSTHPIIASSVPGISRRHDIIAAVFILLSLLSFLKYFSTASRKKSYLFFSVFSYLLALGAKEISVVLPPLIFTYLIIFSFPTKPLAHKVVLAMKRCLPYLIATFIFLIWRTYILQGIGGSLKYRPSDASGIIQSLAMITTSYFVDLLYPVSFLSPLFNSLPGAFKQIGFIIVILSLFIFLLFYRHALFAIVRYNGTRLLIALKAVMAMVLILSLIGILAFPLISPHINQLIQQSYNGEGLSVLTNIMEGRHVNPVEFYLNRARDLILRLFIISLFFSVTCLTIIHQRSKIKDFITSYHGKLMVFMLIWLLLPLSIYLLTLTFYHRIMYISVIPFSSILSIMLIESFQSIIQRIRKHHISGSSYRSLLTSSKTLSFVIVAVLSASLLAYSPLVRTYGEWKDSGNISSMFLHKLSRIVAELPNDAVLHIYNLPGKITSYEAKIPLAKDVAYLWEEYTIKSWLDLNHPGNRMEVVIESTSRPVVYPGDLDLKIKMGKDNNVLINVTFDSDLT